MSPSASTASPACSSMHRRTGRRPPSSPASSAARTSRSPRCSSSAQASRTCSARLPTDRGTDMRQFDLRPIDLRPTWLVFKREFAAYFATPVAAVFLIVFLALADGLTFFMTGFFDRGQADLSGFFFWHPWLFLVLMPAISMRLWAEERRSGTIEILMTLPVPAWQIVLGKWLAAWAFAALALVLTMPIWITVNILGSPDNGVIFTSYIGSWLMAGAFLALAAAISALTKSQVLAFIAATAVSFLFVMAGFDLVIAAVRSWAPPVIVDAVRSMSFLGQFQRITEGVLELPSIIFFVSLIAFCLWLNVLAIDVKKAAGGSNVRICEFRHRTARAVARATRPRTADRRPHGSDRRGARRRDLRVHQHHELAAAAQLTHRPDPAASLFAEQRHAHLARRAQRAAALPPLPVERAPQAGAAARRLRGARARHARCLCRGVERPHRARGHRPAAVLPGRGPRRRLRHPVVPGHRRRAAVLRPRRDQFDHRPLDHQRVRAGPRDVSRIRPHPPRRPARQPRQAGRRADRRHRSRRQPDDANPGAADDRPDAPVLRREERAAIRRQDTGRRQGADGRPSAASR